MLLGVRFVKIVPLRYKFKPISPRDADTANALCLVVCSVPAVCEPPCLLGKRFSIQRALSSRIGRSQARYSVASLLTMCSRHSLASFLVALLTLPPLHRRIVAAYRLRKTRLCRLVAPGGFGFAKIIINCFCSPTHCDRTQI